MEDGERGRVRGLSGEKDVDGSKEAIGGGGSGVKLKSALGEALAAHEVTSSEELLGDRDATVCFRLSSATPAGEVHRRFFGGGGWPAGSGLWSGDRWSECGMDKKRKEGFLDCNQSIPPIFVLIIYIFINNILFFLL